MPDDKIKNYPKTEHLEVVDTIGVPHPFCITSKHVVHASDNFTGRLSDDAINDYEKKHGRSCGVGGCNLRYDEHEQALLVKCKTKDKDLIQVYVKSIVEQCEKDGFAGITLLDGTEPSDP